MRRGGQSPGLRGTVSCTLCESLSPCPCAPFQSIPPPMEVPFLWPCGVSAAARASSPCSKRGLPCSCSALASHCRGLSRCRARALDHRLRSWLLHGMWDLPGLGVEPMSPALAGGFFTTEPPGKPYKVPLQGSSRATVPIEPQRARNFVSQQKRSTTGG